MHYARPASPVAVTSCPHLRHREQSGPRVPRVRATHRPGDALMFVWAHRPVKTMSSDSIPTNVRSSYRSAILRMARGNDAVARNAECGVRATLAVVWRFPPHVSLSRALGSPLRSDTEPWPMTLPGRAATGHAPSAIVRVPTGPGGPVWEPIWRPQKGPKKGRFGVRQGPKKGSKLPLF